MEEWDNVYEEENLCIGGLLLLDSMPDHFRFLGNGGSKGISVWYAGSRALLIPPTPQRHQFRFVSLSVCCTLLRNRKSSFKLTLS